MNMLAKLSRVLTLASCSAVCVALLTVTVSRPAAGQDGSNKQVPGASLTLDEVVKLVKANLAEDLIIARIKRNVKPFDLNSDEIVELRRLGVSETLVRYLIDPSQPYTPPAPPPPPAAAAPPAAPVKPPLDPLVVNVPPENGVYWLKTPESPVTLELKPVASAKQGGKLGSMLTGGLKKGHVIGSLAGASAKARLLVKTTTVFARLGDKTPVEDLVLVMFQKEDGRRELDFGPKAAKPVFPPESIRQFEAKEVGQGVVRISFQPLAAGEYMFFILGSGDEKKGTLGKGWEFGVE